MKEKFIFEKLDVYQKSLEFSIIVSQLCSKFPVIYSRISNQFIGAVISIPLNIAEGSGRKSSKDKINFYKIARSSSFECIPLIDICYSLNLLSKDQREEYRDLISDISKMLSGLISYQTNS